MEDSTNVNSSSGLSPFILVPCDREYARNIGWPDGWLTSYGKTQSINYQGEAPKQKRDTEIFGSITDKDGIKCVEEYPPFVSRVTNVRQHPATTARRTGECCISSTNSCNSQRQPDSKSSEKEGDANFNSRICQREIPDAFDMDKSFTSRLKNEFLSNKEASPDILYDALKTEIRENISESGMNFLFWKALNDQPSDRGRLTAKNSPSIPFGQPFDEAKISSTNDVSQTVGSFNRTPQNMSPLIKSKQHVTTKGGNKSENFRTQPQIDNNASIKDLSACGGYSPSSSKMARILPLYDSPANYSNESEFSPSDKTHADSYVRNSNETGHDHSLVNQKPAEELSLNHSKQRVSNFVAHEPSNFEFTVSSVDTLKREPVVSSGNETETSYGMSLANFYNTTSDMSFAGANSPLLKSNNEILNNMYRMSNNGIPSHSTFPDMTRGTSHSIFSTLSGVNKNQSPNPNVSCDKANSNVISVCESKSFCEKEALRNTGSSPFTSTSRSAGDDGDTWTASWSYGNPNYETERNDYDDKSDDNFCPSTTSGQHVLSDISSPGSAVSLLLYESENDPCDN